MIKSIGKLFLILIVLCFLALFTTQVSGYYEYNNSRETTLTNEAIKKFEEDIKEGKDITINNYIKTNNYTNRTSKTALKLSNHLQALMDKGLRKLLSSIANNLDK